jgi:hypothetical protein
MAGMTSWIEIDPVGIVKYLICIGIGVYLSYSLGYTAPKKCVRDEIEDTQVTITTRGMEKVASLASNFEEGLQDIMSQPFACNVRASLEQLSKLHLRRVNLEKRRERGEANLDRTANIIRKTGQAEASEASFRKCLQTTIPEALKVWDERAKHNIFGFDATKYEGFGNIDIEVLENTADMLDESFTLV